MLGGCGCGLRGSFLFFHDLQALLELLLHGRIDQIQQRLLVDDLGAVEREGHLAHIFHEDWRVGVSVHFHHKVVGELLGDKRLAVGVLVVGRAVNLHGLEVQRGHLLQRIFDDERTFLGAAGA